MLQMVQTETCHDEETAKSTNKAHTMMHHQQPSIVYNNNTILTSSNTIRNSMDVKQTYFSSPMIPFLPFLSNKNLLHHTRDDYENESVTTNPTTNHHQPQKQQLTRHYTLRNFAMDASLYVNVAILAIKLIVYIETLSLSVLAALVDSALDVVSQLILNYTEKRSSLHRSSALYPAGASRLEPLGVLICAALMGMASFEVLKESIQALYVEGTLRYSLTHPMNHSNTTTTNTTSSQAQLDSIIHEEMDRLSHFTASFWGMIGIIIVKYGLWLLCKRAAHYRNYQPTSSSSSFVMEESVTGVGAATTSSTTALLDPTLDALAQDHKNDCLSNIVAAVALLSMLLSKDSLWYLDPFGALIISIYIIHSWYETAKEQIEQLTGKCAPVEFIDELYTIANTFDPKILLVDVGMFPCYYLDLRNGGISVLVLHRHHNFI